MFDKNNLELNPSQTSQATNGTGQRVIAPEGIPLEFTYKGRKFRIHAVISKWRESGGWWNRISEGNTDQHILDSLNDGAKAIWRVEAAPEGAVTTFEIELDEVTKTWLVRPTSRPS